MSTVQLDKDQLIQAHKKGTAADKKLLEKLYGVAMFQPLITETIKTIADVYKAAKVDAKQYDLPKNAAKDSIAEMGFRKVRLIVSVFNQGWTPDWSDGDQPKYYPYFVWDNKKKRFSLYYVDVNCSYSSVGSRLCFRTKEIAEYAVTTFITEYNQMLLN